MRCCCRVLVRGDPLDEWEAVVGPHSSQQSQECLPDKHLSGLGKERQQRVDMASIAGEDPPCTWSPSSRWPGYVGNYPDRHGDWSAAPKQPPDTREGVGRRRVVQARGGQSHRPSYCKEPCPFFLLHQLWGKAPNSMVGVLKMTKATPSRGPEG